MADGLGSSPGVGMVRSASSTTVRGMTLSPLLDLIRALQRRQQGQTMAEYAVVLAVVVVATVAVFTALSGGISGALNTVNGIL
jgi:Flp pilus assembly pilin Flp